MFTLPQQKHPSFPARVQAVLSRILQIAACYVIPAAIALVSLIALVAWHDQYRFSANSPLSIRVVAQDQKTATPQAALEKLQLLLPVTAFDTRRQETPFWFLAEPVYRVGAASVIEFPSRHARDLTCWDTAGMAMIGSAAKNIPDASTRPTLSVAKAGFALRLVFLPAQLLCRATFAGPGHLNVVQWSADEFEKSVDQYHRKSGLLDGGMTMLALFMVIMAAVERRLLYLVFAGWLVLNLRIGAMMAGWDYQWLGQILPPDWLMVSQRVTVVLFAIALVTLYQMLLGEHHQRLRQQLPLRIVQWLCLPTLVASLTLPFPIFVPLLWVLVALGIAMVMFDLLRILFVARSLVATWFALSLAVSFMSGMSRILAEAFDMRALADMTDSVTAALVSTLFAALAVAERARAGRGQQLASEAGRCQAWDAVPAGLFTVDLGGRFLFANPAFCAMLDDVTIVSGHTRWEQLFSAGSWTRLYALAIDGQLAEMDIEQPHGARRFMVRAMLAGARIECVLDDITEAARTRDTLQRMTHRDALTGALNRRGIEETYARSGGAPGSGPALVLAFLTLDRFRLISDLYGRGAGEEVLKQVCERIGGVLTAGQQVGRIGGDAFVILMPQSPLAVATLACSTIVDRIGSMPYLVGDKAFTVHATLGVIEVASGMLMADAIASADRACRDARARAGGCTVAHARAGESALVARLSSPNAMEGMFLEMQPVLAVAAPWDSLNVSVQLRMRETDGSILRASPILAAALNSGRAGIIDRWLLTTTLDWIARHVAQLPAVFFACIKLSGAALNDENFVVEMLAILRQYRHVAGHVCLTIAEPVALQDLDNTRRFMEQLRSFGVVVALDEFGSALSSFSWMKELPADLLKIDAALVADIALHPANAAIIETIVLMARKLGMQTAAVGANDMATVQILSRIGVDYIQGDAVACAQPFDAILRAQSSASFIDGGVLPESFAVSDIQPRVLLRPV
ncbi:MAG: EAL domain-containing protein [Pseudomonadota bacterium]|nr:EAL domain-containing protein [Pseudomonadota bacterium]